MEENKLVELKFGKEVAMDWPHIKEAEKFHYPTTTQVKPTGKRTKETRPKNNWQKSVPAKMEKRGYKWYQLEKL